MGKMHHLLNAGTQAGKITTLVSPLFATMLYVIAAFFMLRILVLVFIGQIDLAAGKPGALADIVIQGLYALLALLLAVNARTISNSIAAVFSSQSDLLTTSDVSNLGGIITPIISMILGLAATLAVSFTLVSVVMNAVKGQLSTLTGSVAGLGSSVLQLLITLLVFGIGAVIIVLGSHLLKSIV